MNKVKEVGEILVHEHFDALYKLWKQKAYIDDFNVLHSHKFKKSWADSFYCNVVVANCSDARISWLYSGNYSFNEETEYLYQCTRKLIEDREKNKNLLNHMFGEAEVVSGKDYENFIARLLENNGYKILTTPATGDQGVDLIAIKDDDRIAIQCKYYKSSVGNKAVQEVSAGKGFHDCNKAWVVTNSKYTKPAQSLAQSLGVELLHHDEITQYHNKEGVGKELENIVLELRETIETLKEGIDFAPDFDIFNQENILLWGGDHS